MIRYKIIRFRYKILEGVPLDRGVQIRGGGGGGGGIRCDTGYHAVTLGSYSSSEHQLLLMSETDQAIGFQGPSSSTEIKAIIEKAVADSLGTVTDSIAQAVDHRLEDFKRVFLGAILENPPTCYALNRSPWSAVRSEILYGRKPDTAVRGP